VALAYDDVLTSGFVRGSGSKEIRAPPYVERDGVIVHDNIARLFDPRPADNENGTGNASQTRRGIQADGFYGRCWRGEDFAA